MTSTANSPLLGLSSVGDWDALTPDSKHKVIERAELTDSMIRTDLRHADYKASPILASTGVLVGLLANQFATAYSKGALSPVVICGTLSAMLFLCISFYCSCRALIPTLTPIEREAQARRKFEKVLAVDRRRLTTIFFGHIVGFESDQDLERAFIESSEIPGSLLAQLIQQIRTNSSIAERKYKMVNFAVRGLMASLLIIVISTLASCI